jgi:GMP synthase-like glutamine amidotransferase
MKILLVDNGTVLLEKLRALIPGTETIVQSDQLTAAVADSYDLVILSGSSREQLVGNESDFKNEIEFIRSNTRPLIGICFGCELIVSAFGGKLRKLESAHTGIKEIEMVRSDLFDGNKNILVSEHHGWITSALPEHFELLARSVDGPEMIKHKDLPVYGLQFHPENLPEQTGGDEVFLSLLNAIA